MDYPAYLGLDPVPETVEAVKALTLEHIKKLCRQRNIKGHSNISKSGPGLIILERLIPILQSWRIEANVKHIHKTLFNKWFLIGSGTTREMKVGLLNEVDVLSHLYAWFADNRENRMYGEFEIDLTRGFQLRSSGIVVNKAHRFIATSTDGFVLMTVCLNREPISMMFPIEIKTRSNRNLIGFSEQKPQFEVLRVSIDAESKEKLKACIPDPANRAQVTNNCPFCNFDCFSSFFIYFLFYHNILAPSSRCGDIKSCFQWCLCTFH